MHSALMPLYQEICKNVNSIESFVEVRRLLLVTAAVSSGMAAMGDPDKWKDGTQTIPGSRSGKKRANKRKKRQADVQRDKKRRK